MTKEIEYVTLYFPKDHSATIGSSQVSLQDEVINWLEANAGPGARGLIPLLANFDNDSVMWSTHGHYLRDEEMVWGISFKDDKKAVLFKLRWG